MQGCAVGFSKSACLCILSPRASSSAKQLQEELSQHFAKLALTLPQSLEELRSTVAHSLPQYPLILVVGGDGTVNQAVQELDLSSQTLLVLPFGRGNDLARALGLPRKRHQYLKQLPAFEVREVDVWRAGERRFINSLGIGLDTQVLETMAASRGLKHNNYMAAFLATLPRLQQKKLRADCGGQTVVDGFTWWLVAMNSKTIGGGIPVTPNASLADGKLDVMVIQGCSKLGMLLKLPKLYLRTHLKDKCVSIYKAETLDITGLEAPLVAGIDGELTRLATKELEVRHAGRLRIAYAGGGTR